MVMRVFHQSHAAATDKNEMRKLMSILLKPALNLVYCAGTDGPLGRLHTGFGVDTPGFAPGAQQLCHDDAGSGRLYRPDYFVKHPLPDVALPERWNGWRCVN